MALTWAVVLATFSSQKLLGKPSGFVLRDGEQRSSTKRDILRWERDEYVSVS